MSHWEIHKDSMIYFCTVSAAEVVIGSHSGTGHFGGAASCTPHDFLNGQMQSVALKHFGEKTVIEILRSLGGSEVDLDRSSLSRGGISKKKLMIPLDQVSRARENWERSGEWVSRGKQPCPHFDALAPRSEGMSQCTELTRALQTVSEYDLAPWIHQFDPNQPDGHGATPLNVALLHCFESTVSRLIELGASVNEPDLNGVTPLQVAIAAQKTHNFNPLRRAKVDALRRLEDGRTYLHFAVERECSISFSPLKKLKIDLNAQDDEGQTALHYAVFTGMSHGLVKLRANPDQVNSYGESAMEVALRGALAHRLEYASFEGSYQGKDAIFEIINGVMLMRVGVGKPRKLKPDVEWQLALKVAPSHVQFIRFLNACVSMCQAINLDKITSEGVSTLQLISDLQRPDFDKALKKLGRERLPPRSSLPSYEKPRLPRYMRSMSEKKH